MSRCRDGVRLSSRWTPMHRVVLPLLWLLGGGSGIAMLAVAVHLDIARGETLLAAIAIFLAVVVVASTLVLCLRTVYLADGHLRVRGWRRQWTVPLHLVESVGETRLIRPKLIRIRLRAYPGMPESITLLAPWRLRLPHRPHPVVLDLRRAAGRDA